MTWVAAEKARRGMVREALEDVLMDRATWTYARLQAGRKYGVELHEETVTQDLLLDISAAFPAMKVRAFTKREEGRNGADWEWWFEGRQWFGLRVQAKRLKTLRSGRLGYDLGYSTGRQVDRLIKDARTEGMQAGYALYNGPDLDVSKFAWGCGRLPSSPAFFGVSLLPATVARNLAAAKTVDYATVGARSRPWSCLASCDIVGCSGWRASNESTLDSPDDDYEDLAWWVALSYFRIEMQARVVDESIAEQEFTSVPRRLPGLRDQPPTYVADLLSQRHQPDDVLPPRVGSLLLFRASTAVE